jgi:hypothetical protein
VRSQPISSPDWAQAGPGLVAITLLMLSAVRFLHPTHHDQHVAGTYRALQKPNLLLFKDSKIDYGVPPKGTPANPLILSYSLSPE